MLLYLVRKHLLQMSLCMRVVAYGPMGFAHWEGNFAWYKADVALRQGSARAELLSSDSQHHCTPGSLMERGNLSRSSTLK